MQQSHHGNAVANEHVHSDPPSSLGTRKNLTFRGPCIVIYSYNESQRDALFLRFI